MRDYEIVYIWDSALTEDQINERLERFNGVVTEQGGGEVTAVDHWGKRRLAFPLRGHTNGYYVVEQFTAEPSVLPELERQTKLEDPLLRHMIVVDEGLPTGPVSTTTPREGQEAPEEEGAEEEEEE